MGLWSRLKGLPYRRTRAIIAAQRTFDHRLIAVENAMEAAAARLADLNELFIHQRHDMEFQLLRSEHIERLTGSAVEALRYLIDEDTGNRRRLWAAREDPSYETAYTDPDPLVSVVIPTYTNWQGLRDRSLPSVLAQDHTNLEVIVAGDAAPEETAQVVSDFGDPRVRFVNLNRRGPYPSDPKKFWQVAGSPNANEGIRLARGRWIAFADDDDEMRTHHLSTLLAAARQHHAEVSYGLMSWHMPGRERTVGLFPPEYGDFGHQAALVHGALRFFVFEPSAALFDEPGDWHWCRRMLNAGVRFHMVSEVVCDVYPTVRDWHD